MCREAAYRLPVLFLLLAVALLLVPSGPANAATVTWDAGVNNTWDIGTTANWTGSTYTDGDDVQFLGPCVGSALSSSSNTPGCSFCSCRMFWPSGVKNCEATRGNS